MTTPLTIERANILLPYLVQAAQKRQTPTYGELAKKAGFHHRGMSLVLGYIRDEICASRNLPMLTAIVANKQTGLPGDDWLPEGTGNLSPAEYRHEFEKYRDLVFR